MLWWQGAWSVALAVARICRRACEDILGVLKTSLESRGLSLQLFLNVLHSWFQNILKSTWIPLPDCYNLVSDGLGQLFPSGHAARSQFIQFYLVDVGFKRWSAGTLGY